MPGRTIRGWEDGRYMSFFIGLWMLWRIKKCADIIDMMLQYYWEYWIVHRFQLCLW